MDIVYNPNNRSSVVNYLTKQFGFDVAIKMYNDRDIPSDAIETIREKVVKPNKPPMPEIDWTDESILSDMKRYTQRTYPGKNVDIHNLTEYDIRMIYTMNRLRKSYDNHASKRKRTVLSSINVIERDRELQTPPLPKNQQKKTCSKPITVPEICRAVKMNGEKCTAKAKNGIQFCCRHSKK